MKIKQLSARIDQQLATVDAKLAALGDSSKDATTDASSQEERIALLNAREKLLKSKDLAWRAHNLQEQDGELRQIRRTHYMGLALCLISVVAILALIVVYLNQMTA